MHLIMMLYAGVMVQQASESRLQRMIRCVKSEGTLIHRIAAVRPVSVIRRYWYTLHFILYTGAGHSQVLIYPIGAPAPVSTVAEMEMESGASVVNMAMALMRPVVLSLLVRWKP